MDIQSWKHSFSSSNMKLAFFLSFAFLASIQGSAAVEVEIDYSKAPDLRQFLENSRDTIKKYWDDIARYLRSPGFRPPRKIYLSLHEDGPIAGAGGDRIGYQIKYAREHPRDMGMSVHEATHLIQAINKPGCPGWMIEGTADYIRFFRYSISPDRRPTKPENRGERGYEHGTTYFLNWVQEKKNRRTVPVLNRACREGKYSDDLWVRLTGQSVQANYDEMQRTDRS